MASSTQTTADRTEKTKAFPTWQDWRTEARKIYGELHKGFPEAEMKTYWTKGMSPQDACNQASSRRKARPKYHKPSPVQGTYRS